MEKTEMIDQKKGKKSRKLIFILALLGIALALLAIIGLIKFGTVFFFIPFWFWTVDKIIELTGANLWLARGFAALFVLPFFYLLKLIFSWKAERRKLGWILFFLLTASLCFTMFFLSEDIYFSFKTGQAKKWYIVTPAGEYKFSDSPGYNTLWGIQYQQVTPEIMRKYVEQEKAGRITKTTENTESKEIIPPIPRENIPEKKVEQAGPEKVATPQQATLTEITPEKKTERVATEKKEVVKKPVGEGKKKITPKKSTFKIVPKETVSEEVISTKTTEETTPEKTITADITVWNGFKEVPALEEAPPAKITPKEEAFSLSPDEEKLIVKEIKKLTPPKKFTSQEEKLFDFLKLLERSGNLPKHEDLLCTIIKKGLIVWDLGCLSNSAEEAIGYLARMGSAKSIPTLMWAYTKVKLSSEREKIQTAIQAIKKREGID